MATATDANPSLYRYLKPRFWPTWCLLGITRLVALIPHAPGMILGRWLGRMAFHLALERRRVAEINLRLCFPSLDASARRRLLYQHFQSLGMAIVETAYCWCLPATQLTMRLRGVVGEQYLQEAMAKKRGVIVVAAHFSHLEMGATLLGLRHSGRAVYRPHNNPLLEAFIQHRRGRHNVGGQLIPKDKPRRMLRALRGNYVLWYSADQDYRGAGMVFAPFFKIPAATNPAVIRLAAMSGAPVLPFYQERTSDDRGYLLHFLPPLDTFPGEGVEDDVIRVNRLLEQIILRQPADYLWVHRRFKTRPAVEHPIY